MRRTVSLSVPSTLIRLATAAVLAAGLAACGGGGSDAASGSDISIRLNAFSATPTTATAPGAFVATFDATSTGPAAGIFNLSLHLVPAGAAATLDDGNRLTNRACSPLFPCNGSTTLACTVTADRRVSCDAGLTGRTVAAGSYALWARACTLGSGLQEICDTRGPVAMTFR